MSTTASPLHPCAHREIIAGSLATPDDMAAWAAELVAMPCPACAAASPAPAPPAEPAPLPLDVVHLLSADGKAGALRAQAALDAMGVGPELYPGIAAQLSRQPGTGLWWRRWWATWHEGVLLGVAPPRPDPVE